MKLALAQICTTGDVDGNLAKVRERTAEAAALGAEAVVFPEATMVAFGNDLAAAAAEHLERWQAELRDLARRSGIAILAGEFEATEGGKVRNLLAVYTADGERREYAKIHLYDAFGFRESTGVEPGAEPLVIEIGGRPVGLAICYDVRFPKLFAEHSRAGAEVMIVSASWGAGEGKAEQWRILARARALDSNAYVVAVDQADPEAAGVDAVPGAPTGVGGSLVADPFGAVVAELGREEGLEIVDLDLAVVERAKEALPVLQNAKLGY
ncbi:hydrolase [Leucobacter sp. CSA1]|uniref:Hydrolase n=1 Tax=Leucobacter chromiisoli TaxID=2796471 RepID=A0A934Q7B0_9MICO|nr:nitrilase-related carbon-nitrogen hydrolase [Leucobacter chromiisoli]MBK0419579.1 hydrolase [Leucobacter chromiisoli]